MFQINHTFSSIESLKSEIDITNIDIKKDSILIQIFTSMQDEEIIQEQLTNISNLFPNATIIGASTDGEILDGYMIDGTTTLSISIFEKTKIKSAYMIDDDSASLGAKIAKEVLSDDSKCIISFVGGLKHSGDIYLESLSKTNTNYIPIAGGIAADNYKSKNTFIIHKDKIIHDGAVAVSLNGEDLEAFNDYNLGWRPVGPIFTVTRSKNNTIYEINNRPILDIYKEVLGDGIISELPYSVLEFPLIKKMDDIAIARVMMSVNDDGSAVFAGNINEGEKIQFGMGSSKLVNQYEHLKALDEDDVQASFIYSCTARKKLLGKNLEPIFQDLASISPSIGFFTFGEFFNSQHHSKFLNITTTILFLNEKGTKKYINKKIEQKKVSAKKMYSKEEATLHLLDYMTTELESRELEVSSIQKLANEYINAVDTTLIVSKTDTSGKITFANSKFEKISGYTLDELIGQPHSIVRHPSNRPEFFKQIWDTIQSGKIWQGSFPNIRKDGTTYHVSSAVIPIHNIYGDIVEYIAIREDVSELVEARMKAENAEANQAAFLANMSHEIRTPMNGILGFSELLLETNLNKTQSEYTNIIKNSTKTLLNIINDILDFSKIKSNKIQLENIEIDLISEIKDATVLLNSLADKKSIDYRVEIDKTIKDYIYSDPTRLKQVITNLISNAIKFTPHRGEVIFSAKVLDDGSDSQTIRFSVKDNGIGIPKDKQAVIFSPYSQAQESTTREFGGTGLGLSISKSFVEAFGGELLLNSEEGRGSTFYFDLTLKTSEKKREFELVDKTESLSQKETISKAKLKVLVAEDYEVNRTFIKLVLSKYKIKPDFAVDGIEAVQKAKEGEYDIIFMDVNMPNMGGVEATQNIRLYDKKTPIIALTANTLEGDRERFLSAGMDNYLSKPVDREKLQDILLKYALNQDITCHCDDEDVTEEVVEVESILENIKLSFANFNDQIIMKLVNTFVKSTEASLQELKKAIDEKDFENIKSFAHKIAGSAGNLKLKTMYENAKAIEMDAIDKVDAEYLEKYLKIEKCFTTLKSELD